MSPAAAAGWQNGTGVMFGKASFVLFDSPTSFSRGHLFVFGVEAAPVLSSALDTKL
jgi:hypothetical protein